MKSSFLKYNKNKNNYLLDFINMNISIKIKRVYEKYDVNDGFRILIDRLWPRGLSKEEAKIDLWMKEIAPSDNLRKWFAHNPKKWEEFVKNMKKS
jgi:uncharacterized protein YeaO (DUF488 family)